MQVVVQVSEGGVSLKWRGYWCLCRCSDRVGGREAGLEGEVAREEMAHVKKARSSNLVGASRCVSSGRAMRKFLSVDLADEKGRDR